MLQPNFKEFTKKAKEGNLIPVYREILADLETPLSAFLKLKGKNGFLFESVEGGEKWARYSFIGGNPSLTIEGNGKELIIKQGRKRKKVRAIHDPLEIVAEELEKYKPVIIPGLPTFVGGLAGYIGYDTVRHFERLPDHDHEGLDLPEVFLMLADTLVVFDNLTHRIKVIANAYIEDGLKDAYDKACAKIDGIVKKLESNTAIRRTATASLKRKLSKSPAFSSNFTKKDFMNAVKKVKKYIKAGDVIQTVISQNFHKETDIAPINAYRALRVINPSPYMFSL